MHRNASSMFFNYNFFTAFWQFMKIPPMQYIAIRSLQSNDCAISILIRCLELPLCFTAGGLWNLWFLLWQVRCTGLGCLLLGFKCNMTFGGCLTCPCRASRWTGNFCGRGIDRSLPIFLLFFIKSSWFRTWDQKTMCCMQYNTEREKYEKVTTIASEKENERRETCTHWVGERQQRYWPWKLLGSTWACSSWKTWPAGQSRNAACCQSASWTLSSQPRLLTFLSRWSC